ncbi:hypothetical protein ACFIQG_22015 [Comamonas odontotermitis]|uniref:hypothetical protein n=1 Tax=Comamonas odontotermitis TaxID=379895 RepID=UPI00366FF609
MSKYEIRQFTKETLEAAQQRWQGLAGEDEFALEYLPFFDWCHTHMTHKEGDSQAWELFNKDTHQCDAIIDLVNSKNGALTKLLKLYVTPRLWEHNENTREQIIALYVDTFVLVIQKGLLAGAKDVKLYGRTDMMLSMLRSLHAHWAVPKTTAEFQGRFFTVSMAT